MAAAPSVSAEAQADAELVIKVFTSMAKVIDANEGDCTKLANALDSWAKENKAEIELMQVALGRLVNLPPEVDELMEQSYGPRMQAVEPAMEKLVDCATEPKITEVLQLLMPAVD
ncbi:MAG: hypothetical protein RBU37_15000 [Myxococcota bacterium]|nr:hypothetical protein [Myxococcota bacterium]